LETFIHPDYQTRTDLKCVKRFSEAVLSKDEFHQMFELVKHCGKQVIVTPFDEASVDVAANMNVDVLKVASCSLTDWPLLEKIVTADCPAIVSTPGASFPQIDQVVNFFQHRDRAIALIH
jgi:sialic acid synthase SpsE